MTPSSSLCRVLLRGVTVVLLVSWLAGCGDGTSLIPPPPTPGPGTPNISVSPTSVTFSFGVMDAEAVRIENNGTAALVLGTVSLRGTDADEFVVELDSCSGVTLAAGQWCRVDVAFSPTPGGSTATKSAILHIPSNDPTTSVVEVSLAAVPPLTSVPEAVDFGTLVVLATTTEVVSISNNGNVDLFISALAPPTGDDAAEFSVVADGCGGKFLVVGGSCDVELQFAPLTDGGKTATLTIASVDLTEPLSLSLQGTGRNPTFEPDQRTVDLGDIPVGLSSQPNTVTVQNTGATQITFGTLGIVGSQADEFTLEDTSTCSGAKLEGGQTCVVVVSCSPLTPNNKKAKFILQVAEDIAEIELLCEGLGPFIVPPGDYDFWQTGVGLTASESFDVCNEGNRNLLVEPLVLDPIGGAFGLVEAMDACSGRAVAPAACCTFSVEHAPQTLGSQSAVVSIITNDLQNPVAEVEVRGFGHTAPVLEPTLQDFGSVSVGELTSSEFSIVNATTEEIELGALTLTGTDSGDFTIPDTVGEPDECSGATLDPLEECSVFVHFAPQTGGDKAAALTVTSAPGGYSLQADLQGRGLELQPAIQVSPATKDFGQQVVRVASLPEDFEISNVGQPDLVLGTLDVTGPFTIGDDGCSGATLAGDAVPCTFQVYFAPQSLGDASGALTIPSNDPDDPALSVSLTGSGISPLGVTPRTIGFGPLRVGLTSDPPQTVTVINRGGDSVWVEAANLGGTDFSITDDQCSGIYLDAQEECTVKLAFHPLLEGVLADVLTLSFTDIPDVEVDLAGVGQGELVANPSSLFLTAIVDRDPDEQTITLTNVGHASAGSAAVTTVAVVNGAPFSVASDSCRQSLLAPGESCTFNVAFAPTSAESSSDQVTMNIDNGVLSFAVNGSGTLGVAAAPRQLSFPDVDVGNSSSPQSVRVTNKGDTITITAVAFQDGGNLPTADFVEDGGCTNVELLTDEFCDIEVTFQPQTATPLSDVLIIQSTTGPDDQVAVSGQGR